jgi:hypothetical protein
VCHYCSPFRNTRVHPHIFSRFLLFDLSVMFLCFVDRCLSFCTYSFDHCVVYSSSIYRLWLLFGIFKLFSKFKGQSLIEMTSGTMRLCYCFVCHPSIVLSVILPLYFLSFFHMWLSITILVCSHISQKSAQLWQNNIKQWRSSTQLISTTRVSPSLNSLKTK